jgi:hypothetical protein
MKTLHILKTEPDSNTKVLMSALEGSHRGESTVFRLYDAHADCEKLIDLIFEHDQIISWW